MSAYLLASSNLHHYCSQVSIQLFCYIPLITDTFLALTAVAATTDLILKARTRLGEWSAAKHFYYNPILSSSFSNDKDSSTINSIDHSSVNVSSSFFNEHKISSEAQ